MRGLMALVLMVVATFAWSQQGPHSLPGADKGVCFIKGYEAPMPEMVRSVMMEDFAGGCPPAGWTVEGEGAVNWEGSATNNSGGTSPEAMLNWSPQFNGTGRLVSSVINTSAYTTLALQFKHYVDDYAGSGYTIKVETSTDGTTWTEAWAVAPTGAIGPETNTLMLTEGIGSSTFQLAFTLVGDSYQINYWYVDDVVLFETMQYDAQVDAIIIAPQIPTGLVVVPGAVVTNMGSESANFDATFEIYDGATAVYTDTYTVSNLASFESMAIDFADWTAVLGDYTAMVTVDLTGDENPDNDMLEKDFQVLDGMAFKTPLFEQFTSATCGPCVAANEVISEVLGNNPGEYSLIKYQMDWPGSGDIYYTEEGGDRKTYYGVSFVPDLYGNASQINPASSLSQAIFDALAEEVTAMEIDVTSSIDEAGIITVDATISSSANYAAGLKAHIVVVEKVTVGNVGSNGETEFHNVMMKMLPGSAGTTLGAISQGGSIDISESYDMGDTNMEEPTDLAVVVFVQDNSNKEIFQSEMIDVEASGFITFNVTFNVKDSDGNVVEGADVFMQGQGSNTTNASGVALYEDVFPGTYEWEVEADGLFPEAGSVTVSDQNVSVDVVLEIPDFYFFEDFATDIPADWTIHATNPDFLYWYSGKAIFFDQTATANPMLLVTPMIDLSVVTSVTVEVGEVGNGTGHITLGTITDPADTETFTAIETFEVGSDWEFFTIDMTGYTGTDSYFAFKHEEAQMNFFSLNTVMMEADSGPPPTDVLEDFEAYTAGDFLVEQANNMGRDYWTTWSGSPASAEDPMVTDDVAYMGSNSMLIEGTNDAVLLFGNKVGGAYDVEFKILVADGFFGYFNLLQEFAGTTSQWGMQAYFDAGGLGLVDAGAAGAGVFNFNYDEWIDVKISIDMNADWADMYVNEEMIVGWVWSSGSFGTGTLNQLGAMNLYAWAENGTPKCYFDDIMLTQTAVPGGDPEIVVAPTSLEFMLESNQTDTKDFSITNIGQADLEYSISVMYSSLLAGNHMPATRSTGTQMAEYKSQQLVLNPANFSSDPDYVNGEPNSNVSDDVILNYDGENNDAIGLTDGGTFQVCAMFPASMVGQYTGMELTEMDVYINDAPDDMTLKIYGQGSANAPGALIYEQAVTPTAIAWNTISLDTPVTISGGDIWVGYEVSHTAGFFVAGTDAGPAVLNGDWISTGATWDRLSVLGLDYNWNIRAKLEGSVISQWLTVDMTSGTLAPNEMDDINLTANSAGMEVGTYTADVVVASNDPANPSVVVSVTLVVGSNPPANLAELTFEEQNDWDMTFGDWSVNDVDMQTTYGFTGIAFPGSGSPMAYIAFNPATTDPPMIDDPEIQPYAGERFGASMASTAAPWNDDWMISPQLQLGDNSVFKLMAKSYTDQYGLEKYNVGVSTSGMTPGDFTILNSGVIEAPVAWTEDVYDISAYDNQLVYVAVQCVSQDAFVFMIDDLMVSSTVGIEEAEMGNISIYPNPATNLVNIESDVQINSIQIINYTGQVVYNQHTSGNNVQVNTNDLSSGVYFVNISTSEGTATQKLLIK